MAIFEQFFFDRKRLKISFNHRKYPKTMFFHYTGHFWAVFRRKNGCQKLIKSKAKPL